MTKARGHFAAAFLMSLRVEGKFVFGQADADIVAGFEFAVEQPGGKRVE